MARLLRINEKSNIADVIAESAAHNEQKEFSSADGGLRRGGGGVILNDVPGSFRVHLYEWLRKRCRINFHETPRFSLAQPPTRIFFERRGAKKGVKFYAKFSNFSEEGRICKKI